MPHRIAPFLLLSALVAACGPEETAPHSDPTADAGEDQRVTLGEPVTLDASASEIANGYTGAYQWSFEAVPISSNADVETFGSNNGTAMAVDLSFLPDVVGTYVLSLTVSDGEGVSNADYTVVTVTSDNQVPTADCGADAWGDVNERLRFDGSASSDPDGTALDFLWSLASTPSGSSLDSVGIYDRDSATPSIVPDVSGTYVLSLEVNDGTDTSAPCYASAHVASVDQHPIADAGATITTTPCESEVQLDGNRSYDPEGAHLTYQWALLDAPAGSSVSADDLSDPTAADPTFTWDMPGTYTFTLQVHDGTSASAYDVVSIDVVDPAVNGAPVADAGSNQSVDVVTSCDGSSCEPCPEVTFELDGSLSVDPDGDALTYYWVDPSDDLDLTLPGLSWTEAIPPQLTTTGADVHETWTVELAVADCASTSTVEVELAVHCTVE